LANCKGANAVNLSKTRVVIVGAGQAGGRAAEALRAAGYVGPIAVIGEEAHPPYERPQLSKSILLDGEPNSTFIRAPDANIQIVGHPGDEIVRGDVANGVGGVTVNAARDMSVLRRLVARERPFTESILKTRILN
jgi:NADPH-dependent 2,4-dienoyl-CoA reductase/sulfur reductase-like enzyme